jgi:putative peptide zinc metalloprotease protein
MMKNNSSIIIPKLEKDVSFYPFDNDSYLVSQEKYNYEINVNKQTYEILQLVNNKNTLDDSATIFNSKSNYNITAETVNQLLYNKLSKYGIIKNKNVVVQPLSRANYLKLSIIIIPEKFVNKMANLFTALFNPYTLKGITLFTILFCLFIGVNNYELLEPFINDLSEVSFSFILPITFIGIFIHELGHAAAAKHYGINSRGIGFGFYLFSPVFFC